MEQIVVVVSITFLVMISPGPDMVLVMRNTLVSGRSAGIWSSVGVLTGNAVHMTYCALGIGWLISQSIVAFSVLKYAGAVYLIYLGIASLRTGASSIDSAAARPRRRDRSWFLQGLFNNVLNPKGTLFYLGVFTMVIIPETSWGMTLVLVMCMKTVSATFWVVFVYTLDQPVVRRMLQSSQRVVNRIFGAVLIGLGLRVAVLDR
jgi:RhtB (resistance to homoserine/threonine) family protein